MSIAREEIFGPVLSVLTFKEEGEALALANDCPYGLAASVITRDTAVQCGPLRPSKPATSG